MLWVGGGKGWGGGERERKRELCLIAELLGYLKLPLLL